jgi:membrane fusion protein, multidrug efflux system
MSRTQSNPAESAGTQRVPSPSGAQNGHHEDHQHEEVIPKDLKKPNTFTVVLAVVVFALLLGVLFYVGYRPHHEAQKQAAADANDMANMSPTVEVVHPKAVAAAQELSFPADVRANQDTLIFPRTNGYLKKLYVDIQDRVEAGQLLAEIDTPEIDAQLAQSKANVEQSKAAVTKAQADLDLAQRLLDRYNEAEKSQPGSVPGMDVDTKKAAVDQATAALASARANVVAAQADVQRLTTLQGFEKVFAPFAGTITSRNYDVGALLSPSNATGGELFRIAQTDTLRVFVNVPQADATKVRIGQPAFLVVRNYPGKQFKGVVARSSSAIDVTTRTLSLELHFPNRDGQLYAGMYGQVKLPVIEDNPVVTIPTSALVFNAGGLQVALVKDGKVHFQKINSGRDFGTEMEIPSGLSTDDQVVSNPGEKIAEGIDVKVAENPTLGKDRMAATLK